MISRTFSASTRRGRFSWNTNPSASAPASAATRASSRFVIPQIFTQVIKNSCHEFKTVTKVALLLRGHRRPQQPPQRAPRESRLHQRLADQERLVADRA